MCLVIMGQWAQNALTKKIVAEFGEMGWSIEYHDDLESEEDVAGNVRRLVLKHRECLISFDEL